MTQILEDQHIKLRALEKEDINTLYEWENLSQFWLESTTLAPYSRRNLMLYLENYEADPFHNAELRLLVELKHSHEPCGFIDLYNVEVRHRRACIGILIAPHHQRKGLGLRTLTLVEKYCKYIGLHQLLAAVPDSNLASEHLFRKANYKQIAILPQYIAGLSEGHYLDAKVFNKFLK